MYPSKSYVSLQRVSSKVVRYRSCRHLILLILQYPSGAPQVDAAITRQAWDIGAAGSVPNILGAFNNEIETIAISNDESATNALAATAEGVAMYPPTNLTNSIAVTPNSTGHYAVEACLANASIDVTQVQFDFGQQVQVLDGLASGAVEYGGLWAPNLYTFLDAANGSQIVCSGKTVGAVVPGGIMVRKAFADLNTNTVLKTLAAWLRGIAYIKDPNNRANVVFMLNEFYLSFNVTLSDMWLHYEIDNRPLFDIDQQVDLFTPPVGGNTSTVERWYTGIADFLQAAGVISSPPPPAAEYLPAKYLLLIVEDAQLYDFAKGQGSVTTTSTSAGNVLWSVSACTVLVGAALASLWI